MSGVLMASVGEFLDEKRGGRPIEEIRAALAARGVDVDHSTVARWFKGGATSRLPQLKHWAVLCDVLKLTDDDLRSIQELLTKPEGNGEPTATRAA